MGQTVLGGLQEGWKLTKLDNFPSYMTIASIILTLFNLEIMWGREGFQRWSWGQTLRSWPASISEELLFLSTSERFTAIKETMHRGSPSGTLQQSLKGKRLNSFPRVLLQLQGGLSTGEGGFLCTWFSGVSVRF